MADTIKVIYDHPLVTILFIFALGIAIRAILYGMDLF